MKNLLTALQAVMKAAGYVQKGGRNEFHKYNYAGEADLLSVLRPAMVEHGLMLIGPSVEGEPRVDEHGNTYVAMTYRLAHVSGEVWPDPLRIIGCGNDKSSKGTVGDKGVYKAYTGGNKYLLFKLFQIATGDDPENVAAHEYAPEQQSIPARAAAITAEQANRIQAGATHLGWDAARLVAWLEKYHGARGVAELTEEKAATVLDGMRELARQQKEAA